jgi:hypothetical protein
VIDLGQLFSGLLIGTLKSARKEQGYDAFLTCAIKIAYHVWMMASRQEKMIGKIMNDKRDPRVIMSSAMRNDLAEDFYQVSREAQEVSWVDVWSSG